MKIALAILLNALLLLLLPWLRRQWREASPWWRVILLAGLGLRLAVGVGRSRVLKLDAEFMSDLARMLTAQLWTEPGRAWQTMTQAVVVLPIYDRNHLHLYNAVYQGFSNTWSLIKLLSLLNLASLGATWLNGFYLSLFAFVGCWKLVRKLAKVFPNTPPGAGVVAFLLWPSVWFWATGTSKEALLLGTGAWLTARVLGILYGEDGGEKKPWSWAGWWLGTAALALLHVQMRYFFAVPLLGVLAGVALGHWLHRIGWARRRWVQVVVVMAVLGAGAWAAAQLSVAFSINKFTNQVVRIYSSAVVNSAQRPHFEYPDLRPTIESIASHAPLAILNTVSRPWLGESREALYVVVGLENAALLVLLALAAVATVRGRAGHLPFGLGLGLGCFCIILAVLMGLTTPNLGSLNRYRSELLPFLLLLLLQNDYAALMLRRIGLSTASRV